MALIPNQTGVSIGQSVRLRPAAEMPTKTYRADFDKGRLVGFADGREAMQQAIFKILSTDRFAYYIYSWNYGVEWNAIMGKSYAVFESEVKRVIREALLADSRITDVVEFTIEQIDRRTARVTFTAETIFGGIPVERTLQANV